VLEPDRGVWLGMPEVGALTLPGSQADGWKLMS
jgi:hypothetical protein